MMLYTTIYTLLGFLATASTSFVQAAPNASAEMSAERSILEMLSAPIVWMDMIGAGLVPRQDTTTPNTPAACVTVCAPINPIIAAGCTPSTCCTASFFNSFLECFQCALTDAGGSNYTEIQSRLDLIYNSCTARGLTVPLLTFPGQPTSRALSLLPATTSSTTRQSVVTQLTSTPAGGSPLTTITELQTQTTPKPSPSTTTSGAGVQGPFGGKLTGNMAVVLMASFWVAGVIVGGML